VDAAVPGEGEGPARDLRLERPGDAAREAPPASYVLGPGRAEFVFELQDLGIGRCTGATLDEVIRQLDLADVVARKDGVVHLDSEGHPAPMLGEWDYSCIHLASSEVDGSGLARGGFPCFDELQGCGAPAGAGQAYERAAQYYLARRKHEATLNPTATRFISHTGHYLFAHYGGAWGASMVVTEVGENINSIQAHLAYTRGAGRQFGIPWGVDVSPWFATGILDYWPGDDRVWCQQRDASGTCLQWNSGSQHGHSLSLQQRTWYLSYMGGANLLLQEGASVNFFNSKGAPTTLSPLGELAREFHGFVTANPDRGQPYVPCAVVVDFYMGLGLGTWSKPPGNEVTWNHFAVSPAQRSTLSLLDALWPNSLRVSAASEANYLVNGPAGDLVDVLADLSDPTSLARQLAYKVLFLSGDVAWTPAWKSVIWNGFLGQGGWLVLDVNPTHDAIFADLGGPQLSAFVPGHAANDLGVASVLAGHVVRVGSPAHYPALVAELVKQVSPFIVEGAGFALSTKGPASWIVTLVNNHGLDKTPLAPPTVTEGPRTAAVRPAWGKSIASAKVLRSKHPVSAGADLVQVAIDPGEVAIIAVELK